MKNWLSYPFDGLAAVPAGTKVCLVFCQPFMRMENGTLTPIPGYYGSGHPINDRVVVLSKNLGWRYLGQCQTALLKICEPPT